MSAGFGEDAARQQTHKQTERDTDGDKPPKQTNYLTKPRVNVPRFRYSRLLWEQLAWLC